MRCSGGVRARHRNQLVERRNGLWSGGGRTRQVVVTERSEETSERCRETREERAEQGDRDSAAAAKASGRRWERVFFKGFGRRVGGVGAGR
jgi:hypothetical protein